MVGETALAIALLVALYLLLRIVHAHRRYRYYCQLAHIERTRSAWAEARAGLMELVRDEQLDARSATFQTFYRTFTVIMRRPDAYEAIACELRSTFFEAGQAEPGDWQKEYPTWPADIRPVLAKAGEGTWMLIIGARGWGRVFRVAQWLTPAMTKGLSAISSRMAASLSPYFRWARIENDLIETRQEVERLSRAPKRPSRGTLIPAGV